MGHLSTSLSNIPPVLRDAHMSSVASGGTRHPWGSSEGQPDPTASTLLTVFKGSTPLSAAPLQHSGYRQSLWRTYTPPVLPHRRLLPAAAAQAVGRPWRPLSTHVSRQYLASPGAPSPGFPPATGPSPAHSVTGAPPKQPDIDRILGGPAWSSGSKRAPS
ncbi:hypothetical protein NDU88_009356 [Pleurodeles waltl]|uniref:Uncharacterized protein n=1 Tax=Pleurodeles waltl TaxID=8319 RepID=A0AAV7PX10_PLEWA|nr:hypothetical protein NDU88_009356 [Pleurodeles waltl]